MKNMLFLMLAGVFFCAVADDFGQYIDNTSLNAVWQQYDEANPKPEFVELTADKTMKLRTAKNYSVVYRKYEFNGKKQKQTSIDLTVPAGNPVGAVLAVQVRNEKNGPAIAVKNVPLDKAGTTSVSLEFPESSEIYLLLILTKNEESAMEVLIGNISFGDTGKSTVLEDFSRYADTVDMSHVWLEFDKFNPLPETVKLQNKTLFCDAGKHSYSLIYRNFYNPLQGKLKLILIKFKGNAEPENTGKLEFVLRENHNGKNLISQVITVAKGENVVSLDTSTVKDLEQFSLLIFFHRGGTVLSAEFSEISAF